MRISDWSSDVCSSDLLVAVVERIGGSGLPAVEIDNAAAAAAATAHLVGLGHRRIAHIAGSPRSSVTPKRIKGYARALSQERLPADPTPVRERLFNLFAGETALAELMALASQPTRR